jgi:hypothetical protein
MNKKSMAGMYLMTGDSYEPFSVVYTLQGPATNSYLICCQWIVVVRDNGALVQVSLLR